MANLEKPITTQEELDQIISKRVKDERSLRQQVETLQGQLQQTQDQLKAAEEETTTRADEVRQNWYRANQRRAVVDELRDKGHTDPNLTERILRHVDYESIPPDEQIEGGVTPQDGFVRKALSNVAEDMPELFGEGRTGFTRTAPDASRGATASRFLTKERIEAMSPEEINQPGMRERVDQFLQGQGR